ncbi:hypothetical protein [Actinomadura macrotermitis]|nr:hypothetical protein [Actinomadura macrotermitis]
MSGGTWSMLGIRIGDDARIDCAVYAHATPILSISSSGVTLHLSPEGRQDIDASDVDNARDLLKAVTTYAAECERLHAEQNAAGEDGGDTSERAA